jgi:hypothetical protein
MKDANCLEKIGRAAALKERTSGSQISDSKRLLFQTEREEKWGRKERTKRKGRGL